MCPRLVSWSRLALALVLALCLAVNFLVVFVLFPSGVLRVLARPAGGLVAATLMANAVLLAGALGVLRWRSNFDASDVGLGSRCSFRRPCMP